MVTHQDQQIGSRCPKRQGTDGGSGQNLKRKGEVSTSSKRYGSLTVVPPLPPPHEKPEPQRGPPTSPPWRATRGANRAEKERKRKGKGRLSASPAYAGEVGGIGDDSGVLFRASRAVTWKDRHDPLGNMAFACLCGAPSLIVISKCSKCITTVGVSSPLTSRVWSRAFHEHACGAYVAPWGF